MNTQTLVHAGRRKGLMLATLAALCLAPFGLAQADLLGVDPGYPRIDFNNTGQTNFNPGTGELVITAEPLELTLMLGDTALPIGGVRSLNLTAVVDPSCVAVGGIPGDDLVVIGDVFDPGLPGIIKSGVLLTGEVLEVGTGPAGPTSIFDFRLAVTGGALVDDGDWPGLADIGIVLTSEDSSFQGNCSEPFSGRAKGQLGPLDEPEECALTVDKKCLVLTPPPPGDDSCDKPIDQLSMIWNGMAEPVSIKAYKGDTDDALLAEIDGVMIGDVVTVSGFAGSPNDVIWEIFDEFGNKLGESTFHLSCSDDDMNGPEDCGKMEGNGKDKDGFLNDWLFEGWIDDDGELDCTPDDGGDGGDFADACEISAQDGVLCTKRPTEISFRYNAGDCSQSMNTQDDGKWDCEDQPANTGVVEPVRIVVSKTDGGGVTLDTVTANVNIGDVVTATAANAGRDEFDSESMVRIYDDAGALIQEVILHTSCSQDLRLGDKFGSVEIAGFVNEEQGNVEQGANVVYSYEVANTGPVDLTAVTVQDDQFVPPDIPGSPIDLLAGETKVLMTDAFISEETTGKVTVIGVTPGGFECMDMDTLTVTVAGPPPCEISGENKLNISDDKIEWKLFNDGDDVATIESIEITWPEKFGAIDKIKLDGDIFKGELPPPSAVVTDFINDLENRQIKAGDDKKLVVEFVDKYKEAVPADFAITVNFAEGCSVTFDPGPGGGGGDWECTKPIDELTMIWDGSETVDIKAWKDEPGETLLSMQAGIVVGAEVSVSGYAPKEGNDVIWEVFSNATGAKLGESQYHLSCSDGDMNGADDCGKRQGNGKSNDSGLINDWLLEGVVDAGGFLDCNP